MTPIESNCALRLVEKDGGAVGHEILWKSKKANCGMAGPQFHRGFVYYVNAAGVLFCLDAKTGEELYSERVGDQAWPQTLGVGDFVYVFGKKGVTTVVKAGPKFEKVSVNALWLPDAPPMPKVPTAAPPKGPDGAARGLPGGPHDPTLCGVAVANDSLFLRVATHLYCVRG
jgi:outer membrane protein assembly factor BamB